MAYHITVTDDDGRVMTDTDTDAIAIAYHSNEGINGHTLIDCRGITLFHLVLSLDELRDHLLRDNPGIKIAYDHRAEIIESAIEIDVGAIKRAMQGRDQDE